jgi:glycosyltransferase involved in cell wall biosynthesis
MITIGYSTRTPNPQFSEYLKKSSGLKDIEIIEKVNNGEKSLSQVYNEIIDESSNNILVLCHDDIYFDTRNWGKRLLRSFEKNPEFGILGVAGSTYMPISGQWWEDRSKMVGVVNHEHQGKKWESKYSKNEEHEIKETIIIDGLFMSLDKNKIKKRFDESVEGFHFYDVEFSFQNHLEGVKVGVVFNVRVTHKSIGMTNEKWEENKNIFAEKNKDILPVKIKYKNTDKLNVLIGCLFFQKFTGSEMYVFELSKNLIKNNCNVTIVAYETNGPLVGMSEKLGIKVKNIKESPGYKIGDGKWVFNTQNGQEISKPNQYYKISEVDFDIIHCQHKPIVDVINMLYPTIDKICTIHSEVIDLENPVIHPSIKKYIAIRPEIKDQIVNKFGIDENIVEVIYNPVDETKFYNKNLKSKNYILFVGSIDYLRENTIRDLIQVSKNENKELWLVGEDKSNYLNEILLNNHVKHFGPTLDVNKYIHECSETAGILLGRTTIESWMCGKPSWIYNVDNLGNIIGKELHEYPNDLGKFNSVEVSEKIKEEYIKILN